MSSCDVSISIPIHMPLDIDLAILRTPDHQVCERINSAAIETLCLLRFKIHLPGQPCLMLTCGPAIRDSLQMIYLKKLEGYETQRHMEMRVKKDSNVPSPFYLGCP